MTDYDRFLIRQREDWTNLCRLGVRRVVCTDCGETDPRCFIGKFPNQKIENGTLFARCERCRRKATAPKDPKSVEKKWKALRSAGIRNARCVCGEDNPFTFERDHIAGRKSGDEVIGSCINCHLKRTSRQLTEYSSDDFDPKQPIVAMRNMLRGIIEYHELATADLRYIEEFLHDLAKGNTLPQE